MHKSNKIVINTSPIISLIAAFGNLEVLKYLYDEPIIPFEVYEEICINNYSKFAAKELIEDKLIQKWSKPVTISPFLKNTLDKGEASVIQLALNENISTVCIDETVGRRIARLNNLNLTGSIGIMIKAKLNNFNFSMSQAIQNMKSKGIWLSQSVIDIALRQSKEL